MSLSDGLVIVGVFVLGILVAYFMLADALNISVDDEDNFINNLFPYLLLLGLASLGSGIGIKVYRWKNP